MSNRDLEGRKIIVTGAASGMGRGISALFARNGARQALIDVNAEGLGALDVPDAHTVVADMSDHAQIATAVEEAASAMGGIDGVVNAAGILRIVPFADTSPETYHEVLAVNLHGPFFLCQLALPHLRRAERATVVNISSLAAMVAPEGLSAYAVSKAGMLGFSRVMAAELAPKIRVNCIAPGLIDTAMTRAMVQGSDSGMQEMGTNGRMRRPGTPEEIAELALFLTSDRSSYINGTTTAIDGGSSWH